jgi:putative peptidoglycan lipid II flippase
VSLFSEALLAALLYFFPFSADARAIVELTAWMFPGLIFICLYGLNVSILQCRHYFFLPSAAPFVCNMVWIGGALYYKAHPPMAAMVGLAQLVVVGFFLQWLLTFPSVVRAISGNIREWMGKMRFSPEIKQLLKAFGLGALVVGAAQINGFFDALFARYADVKGPIYLWYAIRFEQLALALFGMAIVSPLVPALSRAIGNGDLAEAKRLFSLGYQRILTLMIPCTFALIALGAPGVNLIYGHGRFSAEAVVQTTYCLWAYAAGLIPATLAMLYVAVLYAQKEFRKATTVALGTLVLHLLLNALFIFVFKFSAVSTALATTLSSWAQALLLGKEGWSVQPRFPVSILAITLFASGALFCVDFIFFQRALYALVSFQSAMLPADTKEQALLFVCQSGLFLSVLAIYKEKFSYIVKNI